MAGMEPVLDEYVQRLQNLSPFNIYKINADGSVEPWWEVTSAITADLVIYEQTLGHQVQIISGEINKWHRLKAQCYRVWQIEERGYRVWRDRFYLNAIDPEGKEDGWKKPTEKAIEAMYRTSDEYATWNARIERAQEAHDSCDAIVEALRAKRDMLKTYVLSSRDGAAHQLSV